MGFNGPPVALPLAALPAWLPLALPPIASGPEPLAPPPPVPAPGLLPQAQAKSMKLHATFFVLMCFLDPVAERRARSRDTTC